MAEPLNPSTQEQKPAMTSRDPAGCCGRAIIDTSPQPTSRPVIVRSMIGIQTGCSQPPLTCSPRRAKAAAATAIAAGRAHAGQGGVALNPPIGGEWSHAGHASGTGKTLVAVP